MNRKSSKKRIQISIRKVLKGTTERPRVSVFRSNRKMYIQVIDDIKSKTIASVSSTKLNTKVGEALSMGKELGNKIKDLKLNSVVFDRSGYRYHGKVKAVADGLRESGILV